jgi:hypothetical protein
VAAEHPKVLEALTALLAEQHEPSEAFPMPVLDG